MMGRVGRSERKVHERNYLPCFLFHLSMLP